MNEKKNPNTPEFVTIESLKQDIEAMENNEAAWTPEWMVKALMSAWQAGQLEGNTDGYFGSRHARNPFMTDAERREWYGS